MVDSGKLSPGGGHRFGHPGVNPFQRVRRQQPPADAGLIADDDRCESGAAQRDDGLQAAVDGLPLLRRAYVLGGVMIDYAIAVQDDAPS